MLNKRPNTREVSALTPTSADASWEGDEDQTIIDRLAHWSRCSPDARAFTFLRSDCTERATLTFARLWRRSSLLASGLADFISHGDRAILAFNSEQEFIEAFIACQMAGIIAVPASPPRYRSGLGRLAAIAGHADARAILTGDDTSDALRRVLGGSPASPKIQIVATSSVRPSPPREFARVRAGDVSMIQFTSGSTGAPKGIVLTHDNLMKNQAMIKDAFGHGAKTVFAGVLPLFHDMGLIGNVLQPLYLGIPCALIAPAAFLKRPACWLEAISRYGVTTSGGPNFVYDLCVERISKEELVGVDLSRWSVAFNGAERVSAATLERFEERFREFGFRSSAFSPCYGLAEATLLVSGGPPQIPPAVRTLDRDALRENRVEPPQSAGVRLVSCGLPAAEGSVRIVDQITGRALGAEAIGEIWVRSDSVAASYWNDLSATAETFAARLPGEPRTYLRTGDLGFLDPGGALFVTGRSKDLIIIHGQNIYPQDIEETVLAADPRLGRAAAFQVDSEPPRTVVLVEPALSVRREFDSAEADDSFFKKLRAALYRAHSVAVDAVAVVASGSLPKTTSGKLRRSAAAAAWEAGTLGVIARERLVGGGGDGSSTVAEALASALGIDPCELDGWLPLVARGVDSLQAATIANTLEKSGISCSPAVLLAADTLGELERACAPPPPEVPEVSAGDGEDLALGEWQKPFWFAQTTRPTSGSNNVKLAVTARGDFDASLWSRAVGAVVNRHEALRITIADSADGMPRQRVGGLAGETNVVIDGAGWSEAQVERHVADTVNAPFDLTCGPLFRSEVLRTARSHVLIFVAHHVAVDLWSMATIFNEAVEEYAALRDGRSTDRPAPPRLRDFLARNAAALESTRDADLSYWRNALSGEYDTLELPFDRARGRHASEAGARVSFVIEDADLAPLRDLCARSGATLHMALLSLYRVLLYRYTAQPDVLIGTPLARRSRADEGLVGCLVNPAAIRCRVDGRSSFADVLAGVREAMLGAMRHGDVAFHEVVREVGATRADGRRALHQTMFALQKILTMPEAAPLIVGDANRPVVIGGLELVGYPVRHVEAPFDLALMVAEGADQLRGFFEYRTEVFDKRTVERFSRHFWRLLRRVAERPDAQISRLDILDANELSLLERFQRGDRSLAPAPSCVHWLIEQQAARTPDNVAVRWQQQEVTYRELWEQAGVAAAALRGNGIAREDRIGVAMRPSADWVAAMLAAWRAGATLVPLDVAIPPDRLRDIIEETGLRYVISDGHAPASLMEALGELACGWSDLLEAGASAVEFERDEHDPQRLAYIAFTSGSAGKPKGVMITHEGASNFAVAQAARLERAALRRVLQITPASFDAALSDLLMSLTTGGTLCVAPPNARLPGRELSHFIRTERVTLITATPSVLAALEPKDYPDLAAVISMGETCAAESARRWSPFCAFYNGYGPTEASIGTTLGRFVPGAVAPSGALGIGKPFANYDVYVLDGDFNRVPVGVAGEIFVGGPGVARGYVNHADWTSERFVPNPYGRPGERMYRTGDRARWLPDGSLEFLGRIDRQVKLRGVRIEPAEIEVALRAHPSVRDCHVDVMAAGDGARHLVAYVVGPAPDEAGKLIGFLRRRFPLFMIPARFVRLEEIPVRTNGKVDRDKLPPPAAALAAETATSGLEARLCAAWSEVLGFPVGGIDDNFFDLGGHSLLLHELQAAVERHTGCPVAPLTFFDHPTIRTLALHLAGGEAEARDGPPAGHVGAGPAARREPIAIIGMAGRFPGAPDIQSFWRNIVEGRESITFFSEQDLAAAGVRAGDHAFVPARGIVEGVEYFDAGFFGFSRREAEILDPQKRLLLELAQQSLDDAGYAPSDGSMRNEVGVFVGTSRNSYFPNNVAAHEEILASLGHLKVGIASDPGFAATLIAYKLNLSGPCLNVDTACSTSLVAVHQACQSLWAGECRAALAGGASVDVPVVGGHRFEEGLIASPDGHCRAFDAAAAGTVKGMGGGLVVLKRLDAALEDGDHIYAVIRASAVNNDGARKIGFTAPSPEGQALVVRRALEAAGVAADTLGYVEAHGTGTALGDPVEVAALNSALKGAPAGSIAVGSVKSSIGHLDAASGIAGLIKCALVVWRGLIPPQVHLREPNPNIDWAAGPLYVPTWAREWHQTDGLRRAGISSFGIGGTNAHVVLEEAPEVPTRGGGGGPSLIALSAGSAASLRATASSLANALREGYSNLADVAFTLGAGRRALTWRTSFVCDGVEALAEQLAGGTWEPVEAASVPPMALIVFPGEEAAIDSGALAQLMREAPSFAAALEECRALLEPSLAAELEELLRNGERGQFPIGSRLLYAATFAVEYAFWSFLQAAGVRPNALVGQGIGELVALCAAGCVSLEVGLRLASDFMSPAGSPMSARAEGVEWSRPRIPVCSAATGDWLGEPDATHWTKVVGGGRQFEDALALAAGTESAVLIEIGPTPSLLNVQSGHPKFGRLKAHALACRPGTPDPYAHALRTLGRLWEIGVPIDLSAVIAPARRVSLPGVSFDRSRVWLDPVMPAAEPKPQPPSEETRADTGDDVVAELWKRSLGAASVAPDDDFFSSGGDSLLAIEMSRELGERLGVKLPPQIFYEHPTLGALRDHIVTVSKPEPEPEPDRTVFTAAGERIPLSTQQRGLWLASQVEGAGASLNLSVGLRFEGPLDADALQAALRTLVARHPVLLHNFDLGGEGGFQWRAHEPDELVLAVESADVADWDEFTQQQANAPFSVSTDLLVRATLLVGGERMLVVTVHHLVADGWSLLLMLRELAALYADPAAELPLAPSYVDYVVSRSSAAETDDGRLDEQRARLRDLPTVELPTTRSRPSRSDEAGESLSLMIAPALSRSVRSSCRERNLTLFNYLLAAFEVFVRRYVEDDDIVVASPTTNRTASVHDDVVGPFVGLSVFRNSVRLDRTFLDIAAGVRDDVAAVLSPGGAPLEDVLNDLGLYRSSRNESPFRIAFALNYAAPASVRFGPATTARPLMPARRRARHRLMMWVDEVGEDLRCTLEYRAAYYDEATIRRYLNGFERVLEAVTRYPAAPIGGIDALGDDDRKLIDEWNDTSADRPSWNFVQHEIARVAALSPRATALFYQGRVTDYGTLDAEARRVACVLRENGIAVEEPVGIFLERGAEFVIAALGVLYAGGCYVPLDPELPAARIRRMIEASAARRVITGGRTPDVLDGAVLIDFAARPAGGATALPAAVDPRNLAYIMFTSGSTGAPKGVMVEHRALANRLDWMIEEFRFGRTDRVLHKTPAGFDVSVWEIFAPLVVGASLVIAEPGGHRDPAYLSELIIRENVTVVHFVPSLLQLFLDRAAAAAPSLRFVICSGEVLRSDVYERSCEWVRDRRKVVNLYGPTEAAIDVTAWVNADGRRDVTVSIGRPIQNIRIHILDRGLRPAPVGVAGELYIAGAGLARGYVRAPHLTAERFVPDPFGSGGVLYRTGDRARWTEGGELEYLGRVDSQIKLRGMRVELGEIEAVLRSHPSVEDVAVTVTGVEEHERLIAHVVPGRNGSEESIERQAVAAGLPAAAEAGWDGRALKDSLRAYAAARLPRYMTPDEVVLIGRMPVTPNGKLDRASLPTSDPWTGHESRRAEPTTSMERRLAEIWEQVLGRERPALDVDFFESGGNSLLALRLVAAIERELGVGVGLQQLYEHPTIARLAARLEVATPAGSRLTIAPCPSERFQPFPMTEVQQAYAIGRSTAFQLGNISTQGYLELHARGIDRRRFVVTLNQLIRRHDMLRAIICGEGFLKVLAEVEHYEPAFADLRSLPPEEAERAVESIRSEMSDAVLDLEKWPLLEVRLTRLTNDLHVVHIAIDALIIDGTSAILLEREFNRLYLNRDEAPPAARLAFRDFAVARASQRSGEAYGKACAYWVSRLEGLPEAPKLPLRAPLGTIRSPHFRRAHALLDAGTWEALRERAGADGLTAASVLIAAYAEVLARWSGEEHFLLNLPVGNRPSVHPDIYEIVGNFTSTLLLEVDLRGAGGFRESVRRIHRQLWFDLAHLEFDGVEVQRLRARQDRSFAEARVPLVFTGLLGLPHASDGGVEKPFDLGRDIAGVSRTSQVLLDCVAIDRAEGLILNWDHVAEAFPDGMVGEMFDAYVNRLRSLASSDESWLTPLPCAPPGWRAPQVEIAALGFETGTLLEPVLDAARRFADRVAVVCGRVELSYAELRDLACGAAARLRDMGVRRGDVVAVYAEKGWEQVVAALGIMIAGGAYVPVEVNLPPERRRQILEESGARFVVTQPGLAKSMADWGLATFVVERDGPRDTELMENVGPRDMAYVIFTSGSTGRPKGVAVEHGAAANTVRDINERFGVTANDSVLCVSGLGFDLSVYDMFGLLAVGGRLVFPDAGFHFDAEHWWRLMERHRVTLWNTTPLLAAHLLSQMENGSCAAVVPLRLFLLSGDWIPLDLPPRIRGAVPSARVISLGGATEASIWSIFYPVGAIEPDWKSIPYGRALTGQDVVVLDRNLEHCPTWVTGDIYIGGCGLAHGYWNQPELTAKAFIEHPRWKERLYRTGDLGRYLPDGNIEFLGRSDSQVKLDGVRLELGEVESDIEAHGGIDRAIVLADKEDGRDVRRLVAYISLAPDATRAGAAREVKARADAGEGTWRSILSAQAAAVDSEQLKVEPEAFASFACGLEGQYRAAVVELFAKFGRFAAPGGRLTLDELMREHEIAPRYRNWLARALSYLDGAGCIKRLSADAYEVLSDVGQLRDESGAAPDVPLYKVLREEIHSAQLYADDSTAASYQVYYRLCHRIAAAIIAERARLAGGEPLRVLEVGAGYGSLTEHVLQVLRAHDAYAFTDVSNFFLNRAAERFARYGFVTYDNFDIDIDPQLQGHKRHGYDVVVAASVLHNARSIPGTLARLKSALAPGGLLLLIEETSFFPFFDLGMGLQQGFGDFDDPQRPDHPLLSREGWRRALADAGFVRSAVLNRPNTAENAIGFDVVVAQGPDAVTVLDVAEMVRHLEQFLPRAAVPSAWIQVEDFPHTPNGKIDRRSLILPRASRESERRNHVAPRTETERTLAEIWRNVMGLTQVGVLDDFFDIGGDSLVASRVVAEMRKRFGLDVQLRALFETTTVEGLAALIDAAARRSPRRVPEGFVEGQL